MTESGAMCLDFHPAHAHMLVAGLYDGTVCVFNLQKDRKRPLYTSLPNNGKHRDAVWQVKVQATNQAKSPNHFRFLDRIRFVKNINSFTI